MRNRILCIGEAMVEISLGLGSASTKSQAASLSFAGDTLNTAIYLKRLFGEDATVAYCTVLGADPLSDKLQSFIQSEKIDTTSVTRSDDRNVGLYAISVDQNGERSFTYWRNQSAARTLFQQNDTVDFTPLQSYDAIYLSAITLAILPQSVRQQLINNLQKQSSKQIIFDSNYRPTLWESESVARTNIEDMWKTTNIALPSLDDELAIFSDQDENALVKRFNDYGVDRGALKRGHRGPLSLRQPSNHTTEQPDNQRFSAIVNIVDTTAAGDSFNAGYIYGALTGESEQVALQLGHQCATQVISSQGAIIPTAEWRHPSEPST